MATETAYSYQAPDELIYNLLTGADAGLQIDPETGKNLALDITSLTTSSEIPELTALILNFFNHSLKSLLAKD